MVDADELRDGDPWAERQPSASLTIYQNTGGNFDAPPATVRSPPFAYFSRRTSTEIDCGGSAAGGAECSVFRSSSFTGNSGRTDRTKVVVPVHYAGVGCEMDEITAVAADAGYEQIFSTNADYDDEGYVMLSIASYLAFAVVLIRVG